MTSSRSFATARPTLLLASCAAIGMTFPATAETRTEVRVSGGIGVENNPFLLEDGTENGASVAAELDVAPNILITNERSSFQLYGNARLRQFFDGYDTTSSLLLGAQGTTRVDERTQLGAGATFQTSRSAAQDAFIFNNQDLIGLEPGTVPTIPIIDPTIAGARTRFTTFGATGSVNRQLNERNSASLGLAFSQSETSNDLGFDYRVADATLGWNRRLTERTDLKTSVGLSKSDLIGFEAGDAISITPLIGIQQQVSPRLNWSGQVGISYSKIDDGLGGDIENTGFAFSLNGCRRDLRGNLCLTAERQARPTTFSGLTTSTAVIVGYDLELSQRDSIRADATYRKSDRIASPLLMDDAISDNDEFVGVSTTYRRTFTDRLSAYASASYSQIFSDLFPDRDANIRGYVGVSYVFGRRQ